MLPFKVVISKYKHVWNYRRSDTPILSKLQKCSFYESSQSYKSVAFTNQGGSL